LTALVWFRNDLRCLDNQALSAACERHGSVRAVFLCSGDQFAEHSMAPIKADFVRRALDELASNLAALGIPLDFIDAPRFSDASSAILNYIGQHKIAALYANSENLVNEIDRDHDVTEQLSIACHFYSSQLLVAPGTLLNKTAKPYKVFTPFYKAWCAQLRGRQLACVPRPKAVGPPINAANKCPVFMPMRDSSSWAVGEKKMLSQLRKFSSDDSADYQKDRDFPSISGTSKLSAALSIGLVTPNQCLARLNAEQGEYIWDKASGAGTWLSELCWREFYQHVAWHFPHVVHGHSFSRKYDAVQWRNNPDEFDAWCKGKTGYPIVDAAMRQLNQTGWMHNRLRMIVASFLVKDLQIDWRWGERYFMDNLIDGDFAANNGGWQWAAGTGTDAAPYFRIFNPTTQGERFDPHAEFICNFVPELKHLSAKEILKGQRAADYPAPIVDHKCARELTLAMYKAINH
jgi:deoxyribodipyrimidine photo-lyase